MMAGFMSYFGGRRESKQSARDAIVTLRQQLQMIEKKEEHLQKKMDTELKIAKANAITNKTLATGALKRKKLAEQELDRLQGTKYQLETQVSTLESASFNAETMAAMKKAAVALGDIHKTMSIDDVDKTVTEIQDRMRDAEEVAEAISNINGVEIDTDDLQRELEDLEQQQLDDVLAGADHIPVHLPGVPKTQVQKEAVEEDDEAAELKKLQAELAM